MLEMRATPLSLSAKSSQIAAWSVMEWLEAYFILRFPITMCWNGWSPTLSLDSSLPRVGMVMAVMSLALIWQQSNVIFISVRKCSNLGGRNWPYFTLSGRQLLNIFFKKNPALSQKFFSVFKFSSYPIIFLLLLSLSIQNNISKWGHFNQCALYSSSDIVYILCLLLVGMVYS